VAVGCRDPKLLNVIMIDFLKQHRGRLSKKAPPRPRSMSTTRRDRIRKVTERQAAEGEDPTRLKGRIYAGVEIYQEYNGRCHVTLERERCI
jgi:hypothetical protein